jgi:hypothetical protein
MRLGQLPLLRRALTRNSNNSAAGMLGKLLDIRSFEVMS